MRRRGHKSVAISSISAKIMRPTHATPGENVKYSSPNTIAKMIKNTNVNNADISNLLSWKSQIIVVVASNNSFTDDVLCVYTANYTAHHLLRSME